MPDFFYAVGGPGLSYTLDATSDTQADVDQSGQSANVWDSLSSGTTLGSGSFVYSGTDYGVYTLSITANSNLVSFLNENIGDVVVLGGYAGGAYGDTSQMPTFTVTTVPEPSTAALLLTGAAGSLFLLRKSRRI
jgi:hypothetical protein